MIYFIGKSNNRETAMRHVTSLFFTLFLPCACFEASAQDVVLTGHVQKVTLLPFGVDDCPPPCPPNDIPGRVCISNAGGCQIMEVNVDKVLLGEAGPVRIFKTHIGEWGPTFGVTTSPIVVSEDAGNVSWSEAVMRDGKIYIESKRLRHIGDVNARDLGPDEDDLVSLDAMLERVRKAERQRPRKGGGKE